MNVSASLTHRCNLACDYCYRPPDDSADMSAETLERVVDFAVDNTPPGDTLELGFFGGEPFLRLDLMREGVARAQEGARHAGFPLQLRVTTNGTLIDGSAIGFLEDHGVGLCVSVDGPPQLHDRHRRFQDGTGTAAEVANNLVEALHRLSRVQVNAVYGPSELEALPDTLAYLVGLGARLIHLNQNITVPWPRSCLPRLRKAYDDVAAQVVSFYRQGRPVAVNLIFNKVILFLKDGYQAEDRCGMGQSKVAFAPNGDMYPCERLIGHGNSMNFCFGNARTGPEPLQLQAIGDRTGNRNPECTDCSISKYCMNWCGCTNYHLTGSTDVAAPILCASEKAAVLAAQTVMSELADHDLFIDHLLACLHEGRHPPKGENEWKKPETK